MALGDIAMADLKNTEKNGTGAPDEALEDTLGENLFNAYADFAEGQRYFSAIDTDANGFLAPLELTNASEDNPTAARLLGRVGEIEEASNDEFGDEGHGITRADLTANLVAAIESHEGPLPSLDIEGAEVRSYVNTGTGLVERLDIKDAVHGINIEYKDGAISMETALPGGIKGPTDDATLRAALGDETFDAYTNYRLAQDGLFDVLDISGEGTLDQRELSSFMRAYELSGPPDSPELARMYYSAYSMIADFDELKDKVDDEYFGGDSGITMQDLSQQLIDVATSDDTFDLLKNRIYDGTPGSINTSAGLTTIFDHSSLVMGLDFTEKGMRDLYISDRARGVATTISSDGTIGTSRKDRHGAPPPF